jgi:hypothetical protein
MLASRRAEMMTTSTYCFSGKTKLRRGGGLPRHKGDCRAKMALASVSVESSLSPRTGQEIRYRWQT